MQDGSRRVESSKAERSYGRPALFLRVPRGPSVNTKCLVALGANRGDCEGTVRTAIRSLETNPSVKLLKSSEFYRTVPVGGPAGQDEFINAAALLETQMSAAQSLDWLLQIEREMGRQRTQRWGARVIDLDLLLFGDQVLASGAIEVPHPRMAFRRFVLEPAAEVAPEMKHPLIGWSIQQLLDHLNATPQLLAIVASDPGHSALASVWAEKISIKIGAKCLLKNRLTDYQSAIDKARRNNNGIICDFVPEPSSHENKPRLVVQFCSRSMNETPIVQGPVLRLLAHDPAVDDEISAAFEAMR